MILQIFWTDTQFHETVPNSTHSTDTLQSGMKQGLEGQTRAQRQGDLADKSIVLLTNWVMSRILFRLTQNHKCIREILSTYKSYLISWLLMVDRCGSQINRQWGLEKAGKGSENHPKCLNPPSEYLSIVKRLVSGRYLQTMQAVCSLL
jgi:hypothetical protein